jgi:DNA-binding response OmpR family regulator
MVEGGASVPLKKEGRKIQVAVAAEESEYSLIREAFRDDETSLEWFWLKSAGDLESWLLTQSEDTHESRHADLLLVDLFLPEEATFALLKEIRSLHRLKAMPVVVLGPLMEGRDLCQIYALGANSFAARPSDAVGWRAFAHVFCAYWLETVEMPGQLLVAKS